MTDIVVRVPLAALEIARAVGIERANYAFTRSLRNHGGDLPQSEQMANHIRGARCERAVEHYTGLPWSTAVGVLGGPDVGNNVQVRSKGYPPGGDLAFRPARDADDAPFVLVWDCGDHFLIRGWLWGRECRAFPARVHGGGYKYVPPPYRDITTLDVGDVTARSAQAAAGAVSASAVPGLVQGPEDPDQGSRPGAFQVTGNPTLRA